MRWACDTTRPSTVSHGYYRQRSPAGQRRCHDYRSDSQADDAAGVLATAGSSLQPSNVLSILRDELRDNPAGRGHRLRTHTDVASALTCPFLVVLSARRLLRDEVLVVPRAGVVGGLHRSGLVCFRLERRRLVVLGSLIEPDEQLGRSWLDHGDINRLTSERADVVEASEAREDNECYLLTVRSTEHVGTEEPGDAVH